jgi:hypothetical protein
VVGSGQISRAFEDVPQLHGMTAVHWKSHRDRSAVFLKSKFENAAITLPATTEQYFSTYIQIIQFKYLKLR